MIWDGFRAELSRFTGASLKDCHQAMKRVMGKGRVPSPGLPVRFEGYHDYMEKHWTRHVLYKLTSSTRLADKLTHIMRYWRWCMNAATDHAKWSHELEKGLEERGLLDKLVRVEHHVAHAANMASRMSASAAASSRTAC